MCWISLSSQALFIPQCVPCVILQREIHHPHALAYYFSSSGHVLLRQAAQISVPESTVHLAHVAIYTSPHVIREGVEGETSRSRAFEVAVSVFLGTQEAFFGNSDVQEGRQELELVDEVREELLVVHHQ